MERLLQVGRLVRRGELEAHLRSFWVWGSLHCFTLGHDSRHGPRMARAAKSSVLVTSSELPRQPEASGSGGYAGLDMGR